MIKADILINTTVICLIAIVFGCLIGLAITQIVDRRLSGISINMPKMTQSRCQLYEAFADQPVGTTHKKPVAEPVKKAVAEPVKKTVAEPVKKPVAEPVKKAVVAPVKKTVTEISSVPEIPPSDANRPINLDIHGPINMDIYGPVSIKSHGEVSYLSSQQPQKLQQPQQIKSPTPVISVKDSVGGYQVGCSSNNDCNVIYGQGRNKCMSNHQCYCAEGSGRFCHYGPTYYMDPKDMTEDQIRKFKTKAKFNHMTLQDYMNWLSLFEDEPDVLPQRHLDNLRKMQKGIRLTVDNIPRERIPPPLTARQYFENIAALDGQMMPQDLDTGGIEIPSNYMAYSQFVTPENLKHMNTGNHVEQLKKYENRDVLVKTQPKISHDWDN